MGVQHRVEAPAIGTPRERVEAAPELTRLPRQIDDQNEQDEQGHAEAHDRRPDDGLDGGIQVDRWFLRGSNGRARTG